MTGMSATGKQFTYVNQLASSDTDLSKRAEWFTCACCPPNVTRLLGYIGGYLWNYDVRDEDSVQINVHMFSSATLSIQVGGHALELEQKSNWPWEGKVKFSLRRASNVSTTIRVRIPSWAETWEVYFPHCLTIQILTISDHTKAHKPSHREGIFDTTPRLGRLKSFFRAEHPTQAKIHLASSIHQSGCRCSGARTSRILRGGLR